MRKRGYFKTPEKSQYYFKDEVYYPNSRTLQHSGKLRPPKGQKIAVAFSTLAAKTYENEFCNYLQQVLIPEEKNSLETIIVVEALPLSENMTDEFKEFFISRVNKWIYVPKESKTNPCLESCDDECPGGCVDHGYHRARYDVKSTYQFPTFNTYEEMLEYKKKRTGRIELENELRNKLKEELKNELKEKFQKQLETVSKTQSQDQSTKRQKTN